MIPQEAVFSFLTFSVRSVQQHEQADLLQEQRRHLELAEHARSTSSSSIVHENLEIFRHIHEQTGRSTSAAVSCRVFRDPEEQLTGFFYRQQLSDTRPCKNYITDPRYRGPRVTAV